MKPDANGALKEPDQTIQSYLGEGLNLACRIQGHRWEKLLSGLKSEVKYILRNSLATMSGGSLHQSSESKRYWVGSRNH